MNRDPFFRQIIERLNGKLDPHLFELCAADLLRSIYPTLVPIRGGDDAGMDGAIADTEGEPFPLVTTTAQDVSGNLKRSLKSYLSRDGTRRKVVVATSQHLSARRRKNLSKRATELGFTLIQVHDQDAMAYLLYRSPEWCRELLNLTGDPSPLSAVPRTSRPQLLHSLVGRDEDLRWLHGTNGDRLLVGQPGTGKTALLQTLVDEGRALFVISQNRGEIAAALRRQEEKLALIVDDAHLYGAVIPDLLQLRAETGADFDIVASCWPSFAPAIADSLNLNEQRIHSLELLSRDDIVSVIESAGLRGPRRLIKEIVDQALGKPGLAVTLALLSLQGNIPDLISGAFLQRTLHNIMERLELERRAKLVLASLAVGGDGGMFLDDIVEYLGMSRAEVWETLTQLDESGIVYEVSQGRVSVQPPALQHVLVRDVFFEGTPAVPIEGLLTKVPHAAGSAMALLGAKARGAQIPHRLLTEVMHVADSTPVWREYAWMGPDEARWLSSNYPEKVVSLARPLLAHVPEDVIPVLLQQAVGDNRELHPYPDHPLRLLSDWIKEANPWSGQAVNRRQVLLRVARAWLQNMENDVDAGLKAVAFVLFPGFDFSQMDPGAGNTVTMRFGLLAKDDLLRIADFWDDVLTTLRGVQAGRWAPIQQAVENWLYPGRSTLGRTTVPDDVADLMREQGKRMLQDIVPLTVDRPSFGQWAIAKAAEFQLEVDISVRQDFQILYPTRELGDDWRAVEAKHAETVRDLAAQWSHENPNEIVDKIAFLYREAQLGGQRDPRWTRYLCAQIAIQAQSATPWLESWQRISTNQDFVGPFLRRAAEMQEPGWETYALGFLDRAEYEAISIHLALSMESPPKELLELVLPRLPKFAREIEAWCAFGEVPEYTSRLLLTHESPAVAVAAAEGEWQAQPRDTVRPSLYSVWRAAVVSFATEEYWLEKVFQQDSEIAHDWLVNQLKRGDFFLYRQERTFSAAVNSIDRETRKDLLELAANNLFQPGELVAYLVGEHLDIFKELLLSDIADHSKLAPLSSFPEDGWIEKAQLALDTGFSPADIETVLGRMPHAWTGNESDMWAGWLERLEPLTLHEDERIRAIGEIARVRVEERRREALAQERRAAVFGRW